MWYCDDDLNANDSDLDDVMASNDSHKKPPGFYIRRERGLFPAPLPQVLIFLLDVFTAILLHSHFF